MDILNKSWADTINELIDAFKPSSPLTITRKNLGTYSTSELTTSGDSADTTIYVDGCVVPDFKKNYILQELPGTNNVIYNTQAYLKAKDTSGNTFMPQIADIITADRDYRVAEVNLFQPSGIFSGFILGLEV